MRDLYDFANNQLQDSLKQHQEFMFGTGWILINYFYLKCGFDFSFLFLIPYKFLVEQLAAYTLKFITSDYD